MTKKLYKSQKNKMIFGVCGGFAEYFGVDATWIRVFLVILAFIPWFRGFFAVVYILCGLIIPKKEIDSEYYDDDDIENMKSANNDEESSHNDAKTSERKIKNSSFEKNSRGAHSDKDFNDYFSK